MNTDIIEKENGYELQIDLPGVKKKDIKIEMNKNLINISVSISKSSDEDNINASFENGILYLNLPKK